jgi:hypothetical protein
MHGIRTIEVIVLTKLYTKIVSKLKGPKAKSEIFNLFG